MTQVIQLLGTRQETYSEIIFQRSQLKNHGQMEYGKLASVRVIGNIHLYSHAEGSSSVIHLYR